MESFTHGCPWLGEKGGQTETTAGNNKEWREREDEKKERQEPLFS